MRALQENTITRVGGIEERGIDVRVVAATNQNLQEKINNGSFREDLYHRINVIPIHVPPLRERRVDIPLLAKNYLRHLAEQNIIFSNIDFTEEALDVLKEHYWSGNVRELQNVVERVGLLADNSTIQESDIQNLTGTNKNTDELDAAVKQGETFKQFKERAERYFLIQKLKEHNWNITQTAKAIEIRRSHIYNKMNKYEIER